MYFLIKNHVLQWFLKMLSHYFSTLVSLSFPPVFSRTLVGASQCSHHVYKLLFHIFTSLCMLLYQSFPQHHFPIHYFSICLCLIQNLLHLFQWLYCSFWGFQLDLFFNTTLFSLYFYLFLFYFLSFLWWYSFVSLGLWNIYLNITFRLLCYFHVIVRESI